MCVFINGGENTKLKLILSLNFILIFFEIMILKNHIPDGYNVTIYDQIFWPFWLIQILVYSSGVYLVIQGGHILIRKIGALTLLINFFIFLIIPYVLQYYSMNRLDTLTNLGELIEITSGFHIGPENFYPATSVVFGSVALICGVPPNIVGILLPIAFSFIFIIGEYSFSRLLIREADARYLLVPILTIFYFRGYHFIMSPQFTYMMVIPILLIVLYKYLFSKNNKVSTTIAFIVFIMAVSFEHPFIFIFIFYILLLSIFIERFSIAPISKSGKALSLLSVIFLFWLTTNYILLHTSGHIIDDVIHDMFSFTATEGVVALQSGIHKVSFEDFLIFLSLLYGRYLVPIAIIFIALFMFFKNRINLKGSTGLYQFTLALFVIFGIMDLAMLLNPFFSHKFERVTTLNFFIYALIPLFSYSLYLAFLNNKTQKSILMVTAVLTIVLSMSLFGAHQSPFIFLPNGAVTYNEVGGMSWIFDKKNASYPIIDVMNNQEELRFYDLFFGPGRRPVTLTSHSMPDHFSYNSSTLKTFKNQYITISWYDEFLNKTMSKLSGPIPFNSEDFKRFRADPDISKIYDSLNIRIYKA